MSYRNEAASNIPDLSPRDRVSARLRSVTNDILLRGRKAVATTTSGMLLLGGTSVLAACERTPTYLTTGTIPAGRYNDNGNSAPNTLPTDQMAFTTPEGIVDVNYMHRKNRKGLWVFDLNGAKGAMNKNGKVVFSLTDKHGGLPEGVTETVTLNVGRDDNFDNAKLMVSSPRIS